MEVGADLQDGFSREMSRLVCRSLEVVLSVEVENVCPRLYSVDRGKENLL